ncbi:MAG: pyridoxal phosphate-dependent aminotransferase [Gemmatimonadetes bacterium]|nr:pyridoxal phosphate-dependent aminotransferase [Gemmatimonadota bacterium]
MMTYSQNISRLQPSATMAVSALAKKLAAEGRDIIDLSAGEPDFDTPGWISEAAIAGIHAGRTRYTPASGLPELRKAVARSLLLRAANGWEFTGENVVVSAGAKQALFNACFALFGPGDDVLVASPYWTSYPEMVTLARAEPVFVTGPEERGFNLTLDDLERVRTPATRGLILCSPSNPSGAVYSLKELRDVARWAKKHDVWLISDEIYRWIYFSRDGGTAPSLLDLDRSDVGPFVLVDGVSKTFAMTGWRIGYSVCNAELAEKIGALQSQTTSNAATPSQMGALAALTDTERAEGAIGEMVAAFRRRKELVVRRVGELLPHLSFVEPQGAFYLFLKVEAEYGDAIRNSQDWCARVLEETGVACVPGSAFGDDRFVRISFATSDEKLEEAIRRLAGRRTARSR